MCGLTGFLDFSLIEPSKRHARIQMMTDSLLHRGPDDYGIWLDDRIALGHRRLAVLDLSEAGKQPMNSACDRFVIAFNGEVYNHLDLRLALENEKASPVWRGNSDTETLIAAIACWGLDKALSKAVGMFALALWDRKNNCLFLARDRMGEKPLYWGWAGRALVFGSELKSLRKHPDFPMKICREATLQYLRFCYVPAPRSIHPGVFKLEPGCILEVKGSFPIEPPHQPLRPGQRIGNLTIRRYWSLNETIKYGANNPINDEECATSQLDVALNKAVERQSISDVPLGAFLSGGIDSSLVVALMQSQTAQPVQTFTVGFDESGFDESPHAKAVARHLGTNHTELSVTDYEARDIIPELPDLYDEPFADSSQIPMHIVCRAAKKEVTVAISGDGGDELFGGYNRYFWGPKIWSRLDSIPFPVRKVMGATIKALPVAGWDAIGRFHNFVRSDSSSVLRAGDKAHRLAERLCGVRGMDDLYRSLISEWDNPGKLISGTVEPLSQLDDPLPSVLDKDPTARMMVQDIRTYLPDDILCKVDRAAMGVSLETRVPMLDPEVVALSARLPMNMKIRDGKGKWALRQILYRHVPQSIIERPKAGFGIPVGVWLRGPLREWAEDLLSEKKLSAEGLLNPEPIRRAWAEHLSERRDWTYRLWNVLMLQTWRERVFGL
ncbi:asparagine synthase (glutamine-hydrolyzing) [Halomonas icarae]|uniref:asparagine synthase (glutamine-hydrolyzing) n=1 Tax=Halomonas icarae TaxID=2691040 RepID=A0A7X5AJR9_9GAMM|nr:asparagine synthase (glutamine-hydrolyzing) [Halomonas icarae]MDR5903026.1 asparagine synthase (glutamine-hydrolyzing) [Halomonas icarae]NAW11582.1 asparagine synthase (glutamine-hydrolyzing) [Halomonas icarae]